MVFIVTGQYGFIVLTNKRLHPRCLNSFVRFTYSLNVFIIQRQLSFLYTGNAMSST
jgi:hypothetical protein